MDINEYYNIKDYSYNEAVEYFKRKYGLVPFAYGNIKNKENDKQGYFIHHIGENVIASLSNSIVRKNTDSKWQQPDMLVYCDYLEHFFLHILIGESDAGLKNLGLEGAYVFIGPTLCNFYNYGIRNTRINSKYFDIIENNKNVFDLLLDRYNKIAKNLNVVLEHNITLYTQVEGMLKEKGKALIVLGTGLGKTTTALQYLIKHNCRALVIVPNNLIRNGWEEYDVCDVKSYMAFSNDYDKIDFSQYSLVVLDEAHHAGYDEMTGKGAKVWSKGIDYIVNNNKCKVLGMTATNERSDDIDIAKTIFKGCLCEGMSVEDAIEQKIIHPFSYVSALYDTKGIYEDIKKKFNVELQEDSETTRYLKGQLDIALNDTLEVNEILMKYMPNGDTRKGIVFIQKIEDKEPAIKLLSKAYPNAEFRAIDSRMSEDKVIENREWFKTTDKGFLIAVDMISEGAHYKGVNVLIMFRRTASYLVYTQQIGRIITLAKDENSNAIVFDFVNNIDNISYNRQLSNKTKHSIKRLYIKLKERIESEISGQYIIKDESRKFVDTIRELKEYFDDTWEPWEDDIIRQYYPTEGPKGCQKRIEEEFKKKRVVTK